MKDPFKWLENTEDSQVVHWYQTKNDQADEYFKTHGTDYFAEKLLQYSMNDLRGVPHRYGAYTYWIERGANDSKSKLMMANSGGNPRVCIDLNESELSLDYWIPSPTGSFVVYGISKNGNEETTLKIRDVEKNIDLNDAIAFAGFTDQGDICWISENSFVYPRMNGFSAIGPKDKWLLGTKLYIHVIGENPKHDQCIFGGDLPDTVMLIPTLSSDGTHLYVAVCEDELTHTVYLVNLATGMSEKVTAGAHAAFRVKAYGGRVYMHTNHLAKRYRIIGTDESAIPRDLSEWDEIIPEHEDVLKDFWLTSNQIVAQYSHNVSDEVRIFDFYGNQTGVVALDHHISIGAVSCRPSQAVQYISYSGFNVPSRIIKLRSTNNVTLLWERKPLEGDTEIDVRQYFATSKDGTQIPYYVLAKKNSSPAPTIIYGYGGFNISLDPSYVVSMRPWIRAGGVFVIANLRGGSEFGEEWHAFGALEYKQNTFDDCIAVATDLVDRGLTTRDMLGVMGGSNGGLLVAAVTVQRPDLFRAGAALVPLTDMLEFYKHQVAEFWVHEYGDPRKSTEREWILGWSPYHYPIKVSKAYPALYYETALHDARVHPFHAFKMVAKLEDTVKLWKGPLVLRTMTDTGHQGGNLSKLEAARRTAEYYEFFARELGLTVPEL